MNLKDKFRKPQWPFEQTSPLEAGIKSVILLGIVYPLDAMGVDFFTLSGLVLFISICALVVFAEIKIR